MAIENKFTTFALGDDGIKSVYEDSSAVGEYNSGFIAGTLINCRTINSAFRMTTLVTNALLNALGLKNAEYGGLDTKLFDVEVDPNTENGVVFKDIDTSSIDSIGNRSTMNEVVSVIFNSMRNFKPKNTYCADYIHCSTDGVKANRKYREADTAFVHLNGTETINGKKRFKDNVVFGGTSDSSTPDIKKSNMTELTSYSVLDVNLSYDHGTDTSPEEVTNSRGGSGLAGTQGSPLNIDGTDYGSYIRPEFTIGHNSVAQMRGSALGWDNVVKDTAGTHQYAMCLGNGNYCYNAAWSTVVGTQNKSSNAYVDIFGTGLTSFDDHQTIIGYQNMDSAQTKPTGFDNGGFKASFIITANAGNSDSFKTCNMIEGYSWVTGGSTQNHALYLNCATYCNSTVTSNTFNTTSDRRLKENITDYNYHDSILDIPVKEFDMKSDGTHHIGCIAQDLQEKYPELVSEDSNGYLRIEESKLIYLLMEEVKALKTRIETLEREQK